MIQGKDFPVFDGDSHVLEPLAVWQEYLEPEYRVLARSVFWRDETEHGVRTIVNGKLNPEPTTSRIPHSAVWRPGMTLEDVGDLGPDQPHPINPGAQDPRTRLQDMDAMGIDQALIFPTLFAEHFPQVENPDVAGALARAYNNWAHEFCKAVPDRLFAAAVLPLQEIGFAVEELRRVASMGFKAAFLRPAFYNKIYLNHQYYDPLWKEIERIGMAAALHPSVGNSNPEWFSHGAFVERVSANFGTGHPIASTIAPIMDNQLALLALFAYAHFDRFPELRIAFLHSKAAWLELILEKSEGYLTMHGTSAFPVRPQSSVVWEERNGMIGFDADEYGVQKMYGIFEDRGIWGSRYPNRDAMSAFDAIKRLSEAAVPQAAIVKMLGQNAAKTYGVTLATAKVVA